MPIYYFECSQGHRSEELCAVGTEVGVCECGSVADRVASFGAGIIINHAQIPADQQRYNLSLFREATEERDYMHRRESEHAQVELPVGNLWKKAVRQAALVKRGLAPPPSNNK